MRLHVFNLLDQVCCTRNHIIWVFFEQIFWQRLAGNNLVLARVCFKRTNGCD